MEKMTLKRKLHQTTSNKDVIMANKNHPHKRERVCITDYSPMEYEELVFMQPSDYEKIFGSPDGSKKCPRVPVVKITNPNNQKSVHLLFRTSREIKGYHDYAVMTYTAIKRISDNREEVQNLEFVLVSKGNRMSFYWNHPNIATRIAIRMGAISIFLGLLSFIVCLIP